MEKPKQTSEQTRADEDYDVCRAAAKQITEAEKKALQEAKKQRETAVKAGQIVKK